MKIVNPNTSYPVGQKVEDINNVPMRGWPEKQGWSFSRHGYTHARDHGGDADAIGAAMRSVLRPLSKPTLERARAEYAAREVRAFPKYFIIEPVGGICSRRCPFCTINIMKRYDEQGEVAKAGMLKWSSFTKLMDECSTRDVFGLSTYQLGEPMHYRSFDFADKRKDIADLINYAKRVAGFRTVNISTHGDVKNLSRLFDCDVDDVLISLDGVTHDTYIQNRPSTNGRHDGSYTRTVDRVMAFLAEKVESGVTTPFIRLQIINKSNTASEIIPFVRKWIDVPGVDDVFCKNLDSMRSWLGDTVVSDEEDAEKAAVSGMACQHLWAIGSIVYTGALNGCCHDALTELTDGAHIRNTTFEDWWNGDFMTKMRNEHDSGTFRSPCADCRERDVWL